MLKKHRQVSIEKLHLTNPQREGVLQLLASQKNKYRKLLHEAHERLHVLADMTSCLEFWQNIDGHFEHISPVCEKITGYAPAEFFNFAVHLEDVIHPDSRAQFLRDKRKALLGTTGTDVEYKFLRKEGTIGWALASWQPVVTRRGHQIGVRISITDVTRQKMYQEQAERLALALRTLASDPHQTAMITVEAEGAVLSCSGATAHVAGVDAGELLGRSLPDLLEDPAPVASALSSLRAGQPGGTADLSVLFRGAGADSRVVRISFTAIHASEGRPLEIVCLLRADGAAAA